MTRPHVTVSTSVVTGQWYAACVHPGCPNNTWIAWCENESAARFVAEDHEDQYAPEIAEWESNQ